jgi:hypothetical protein
MPLIKEIDTPTAGEAIVREQPAGQRKPALSVIIVTPDSYDTIRNLMGALRAQTAREALELVIVAPAASALSSGMAELDGFCGYCIVEVGIVRTVAEAKAVGVRHATAPVVVMTEDHSLPAPGWAQALIDAHGQGFEAVGPAVENGNPESLISWADFIIGYGPWFDPPAAGEVEDLPGHNSSYKRELLLEYKGRLVDMLAAESTMHQELRAHGRRLYLEPRARTFHANFTRLLPWMFYLLRSGRMYAAQRAESWSPARRGAFGAGSFLIPLVRLRRLLPGVRRSCPELMPRVLAPLLFALIVDAAGQCMGYSFGAGRAGEKLARLEFHRNAVETDVGGPLRREDRSRLAP